MEKALKQKLTRVYRCPLTQPFPPPQGKIIIYFKSKKQGLHEPFRTPRVAHGVV